MNRPVFITWRLHGSLPAGVRFENAGDSGAAFASLERALHNSPYGPRYLAMPEIAQLVVEAIHFQQDTLKHGRVHSYCVMPNHVHLLITPLLSLSKLTHSIKRHTSRCANAILGRTSQPFWQAESYDRIVRNREELRRIVGYIEFNPVKANLVASPEEFRWSSAYTSCREDD